MLIPEATERRMLRVLGARKYCAEIGDIEGLFNDGTVLDGFGDQRINSSSPQLRCLTCDVERLQLNVEGASLTRGNERFSVRTWINDEEPGHTVLILDRIE